MERESRPLKNDRPLELLMGFTLAQKTMIVSTEKKPFNFFPFLRYAPAKASFYGAGAPLTLERPEHCVTPSTLQQFRRQIHTEGWPFMEHCGEARWLDLVGEVLEKMEVSETTWGEVGAIFCEIIAKKRRFLPVKTSCSGSVLAFNIVYVSCNACIARV